jgi:hypothetical protein
MKSTDILPTETLQSLFKAIDLLIEILDANHRRHSSVKNYGYLITLKQIKANFSEIISNYLEVKNGTRKN